MANRTNYEINGNKYWRIKRVIGHSPDGKPIHKYFYGVNRKDALNKYDEWKNEKDNIYTNNDVPFSDLADYYAENVLSVNSSYTQNTIDKYLYHYNRFVRGKFNPLVSEIKPMTIQKFYNSLDVTYSTMSAIHKFMRGFFKWTEQNSYCPDFSRSVLLPDKPRNKKSNYIITWSDDEIKTMFDAIEKCNLRFIVVLALYTGMRMGEVQGLKFSDFRDDYILIERQYQNGSFVPTKGKESRVVPIHDAVRRELERYPHNSEYVFTTHNGNIMDARNIRRSLNRFYDRIGVERKKFHAFRATFCTNLCKNGVPIQTASKLMGHKSVDVTAKYYASVSLDEKKHAMDMLPDYGKKC